MLLETQSYWVSKIHSEIRDMFFHIVLSDKDSGERFGSVLAE